MFQLNNAELFVDREEEVEAITKALTTGDVLVLGEAGIGKTAIINKIVDNLTNQKEPQTIVICLNATPRGYPGWLSETLIHRVYNVIKSNEKMLSKVTKWLRTYGPDILEIIRNLSQVLAETVGKQSMVTSLVPTIPDIGRQSRPKDYKQVVFLLLDQLSKHVRNGILIIIEDSHALSNYDKEFLANLLANHPRNVHVLISRRPQEEDGSLLSSPEVRYLMKQDRLIKIHGLNKDAAGLLLEKRNVDYDRKSLGPINDFLNGNPYFLNLLASIAVESRFSLRGGEFRKLLKLGFQKLGEYLHSQVYMNLTEFESVLRASSILPSNIHAELLSYMLNNHKLQEIHDQILELERRGILCKDEVGGYAFSIPYSSPTYVIGFYLGYSAFNYIRQQLLTIES